MTAPVSDRPLDLVGIGIGPFNLSLAALAHGLPEVRTAFYDQRPAFRWHPGLLLDGATLQVPFLADLVTLADPCSPWSFLNYLRSRERLFPFYFAERFHVRRAEYDAYCRWVSEHLPDLHFGHLVHSVRWDSERGLFQVEASRGGHGAPVRVWTRNVVVGVGSEPHVPAGLRQLTDAPATPVIHSTDYLDHRSRLLAADHVTVVGSGQSGAEIFLDLLRERPAGAERLHWMSRSAAFAPMEYSKLGLEHFTPDYTRFFHGLAESVRDELLPSQWQLHKGIDDGTITAIHDELYSRTLHGGWPDAVLTPGVAVRAARHVHDGVELGLEHRQQDIRSTLRTGAVVLATGYRQRRTDALLADLQSHLCRDSTGRPLVDERHRLVFRGPVTGAVFVQNAERHSHGVGAPDLGLGAWRSAVILNTLTGRAAYPLPSRTAFTTFGLSGRQSARRTPERREDAAGHGTGPGAETGHPEAPNPDDGHHRAGHQGQPDRGDPGWPEVPQQRGEGPSEGVRPPRVRA